MASSQARKDEILTQLKAEDIHNMYRQGKITALDHNRLLREKAHVDTRKSLGEDGYMDAFVTKFLQKLSDGWENISKLDEVKHKEGESLLEATGKDSLRNFFHGFKSIWGTIQVLTSAQDAFGEVNGEQAERMALARGTHPAIARLVNISVNIGSQGVPVGMMMRGGAKIARKAMGAAESQGTQLGLELAPQVQQGTAQLQLAMSEALKASGVAPNKVTNVVKEAVEAAGEKVVPSFAEGAKKAKSVLDKLENLARTPISATSSNFKLPADLAGAKPRFNVGGKRSYRVEFESDLDKALFILAQDVKSKADSRYLEAVKGAFPGVPEGTIRSLARFVKSSIKAKAIAAPMTDDAITLGATGAKLFQARMISRLAEVAKTGDPEAGKVFAKALVEAVTGEVAEGKIRYSKEMIKMLSDWAPEAMAKGGLSEAMRIVADDVSKLAGRPDRLAQLLNVAKGEKGALGGQLMNFDRTDIWPKFREAYINLLLPFGWAGSAMGNSITTGIHVAERFAGSLGISKIGLGTEALTPTDAFYFTKGMTLATGDAIRAMGKAFAEKDLATIAQALHSTPSQIRKLSHDELYRQMQRAGLNPNSLLQNHRLDFIPGELEGIVGKMVRLPGSAVASIDNGTKVILYNGSKYSDAIRMVHQDPSLLNRLGFQNADDAIRHLYLNPTAEMQERALNIALNGTFQNDLGKFAQGVKTIGQYGPLVLYFPFMKTPINITKYVWNRTPGLQLVSNSLWEDIKAGGVRADLAVGRLTISNLFAMYMFELAKEGFITGRKPVNPELQAAWLARNEEYSARTPKGSISLKNLEPLTPEFAMMADIVQVLDQMDQPSVEKALATITMSIFNGLGNNGWFQGFSQVADAVQGIQKGQELTSAVTNFMLGPLTTVASGGPLGSRVKNIVDPVQRDTWTVINNFVGKTAWGSTTIPAVRDGYGDVKIPPSANWFGLLGAVAPKYKEQSEEWFKKEGERLQANLPEFERAVGPGALRGDFSLKTDLPGQPIPVPLSDAQRDDWQVFYNQLIRDPKEGLNSLQNDPGYNDPTKSPWMVQRMTFSGMAHAYKRAAFGMLLDKHPDLANKIAEHGEQRWAPAEPSPADANVPDVMGILDTLTPEEQDNVLKWGTPE